MTIQKKIALIFTSITATILLLFGIVAYFFMNRFAFQDYYKRLEIRGIISAKAELAQLGEDQSDIYKDIRQQHLEALPGETELFFSIDHLGAFRKANSLKLPQSFYNNILPSQPSNLRVGDYFYTGFIYQHGTKPYVVIVGAQNEDSLRYARNLALILVICWLSGIAVAYTFGIFFSRHTFKPVRDIIRKVDTISVQNLHLRLEDRRDDDEIAVLASTFNDMLSRLETSFETQNNFVSNASHELRTPLTAIYGEAEIALSRPRNDDEYKQALKLIIQQAEKLQRLTDSLLSLAQTGFDGKKHNMKLIRIDELLLEVKETINKIIPNNKINIDFSTLPHDENLITVKGNEYLLKLGFSNVMENACKYSGNDDVLVTINYNNGMIAVTVIDKGIGIPAEELKHIYDPFFRASNTGKFQGYGIGLPLTRNIFRLHKGSINVQSHDCKGTQVELCLPVAAKA